MQGRVNTVLYVSWNNKFRDTVLMSFILYPAVVCFGTVYCCISHLSYGCPRITSIQTFLIVACNTSCCTKTYIAFLHSVYYMHLIYLYITCISSVSTFQKVKKGKGKVFYGQEPTNGESTTTECGVNYQLLAVIY